MEILKRKDHEHPERLYNEDVARVTIYATNLCQSWWQELAVEAEKRGMNTSIYTMVEKEVEAAYPLNVQRALVEEQNKSLSTVRRDLIKKVFNLSNWNYPHTTPRKKEYVSTEKRGNHMKQLTHKEYNQMIASLVGKELFAEFEMDAARSRTTPKELLAAVVGKFVEQQQKKRAEQRVAEVSAHNTVEE